VRRRFEEGRLGLFPATFLNRIEEQGIKGIVAWLCGSTSSTSWRTASKFARLLISGFSLKYTHCMGVLGLRRRQHRMAARVLGLVLLAGVFALTSTPVCGSALDVDPVACCEHHACGQSPKSCPGARHLQQSRGRCCSMSEGVCDAGSGAERCCELGQLSHPTAKLQPSASVTHVLNVVAALALPSLAPSPTFSQALYAKAPLKIPLIPLYTLTATYRI